MRPNIGPVAAGPAGPVATALQTHAWRSRKQYRPMVVTGDG